MDKKKLLYLGCILIVEYLFIFSFLLNYDVAWMNPEKFGTHNWILSNGPEWKPFDWIKFLDIDVIENNPDRLSRPLSNFVEVVNAKFRANCWRYMMPHPSLSILWPFLLVLLPYLLYRTFVNMGCYPYLAFAGVCVYLSTPGFLGPVVMLFHPAKDLVNLFSVVTMFLFSLSYKRMPDVLSPCKWAIVLGFVFLYLGFISDETGLYTYLVVLMLFYRLWWRLWEERQYLILIGLLSLPVIYFWTIKYALPWLHWFVRNKSVHLNNYESYPSIKSLFWPNWHYLFLNVKFLLADHPHCWVEFTRFMAHPVLITLQIIYVLCYAIVIIKGGMLLFKKGFIKLDKNFIGLAGLGLLLMFGYCFFHTFQLSNNAKVWGVWWQRSLFSLLYVFTFVYFLQFVFSHNKQFSKWVGVLLIAVFVINGLAFTTYRIAAFRVQNLNHRAFKFADAFKDKIDIYQEFDLKGSLDRSNCKRMFDYVYWQRWRSKELDVDPDRFAYCKNMFSGNIYFSVESIYMRAELYHDIDD